MTQEYRENIKTFAESAEEFSRAIERVEVSTFDFSSFVADLDAILPLLYYRARNMAAAASEDVFELERAGDDEEIEFGAFLHSGPRHEYSTELAERLNGLLCPFEFHVVLGYTEPANPEDPTNGEFVETEVETHYLGTELARICARIRDALTIFRTGSIEDAGRDWLIGFYGEWGRLVVHLIAEVFNLAHEELSDREKARGL